MIRISEIYDKDVSFLLGSGASVGLLPTLRLELKKEDGGHWSLEELATHFEQTRDKRHVPLFMHYYASCIRPAQELDPLKEADASGKATLANYQTFLETVLAMLQRRPAMDRRCNLFTTNYDGCVPFVAERMLRSGIGDFVLNDGTRGFRAKILQAAFFNSFLCQTGIFDRHQSSLPQINLIHLHGSVYWKKVGRTIEVDYSHKAQDLLDQRAVAKLEPFSTALQDPATTLASLPIPAFSHKQLTSFWEKYQQIPVVNPTKWKFHETLFEEHYYQMLRLLSYELEKPNAVLITFGFSFADEHILQLVKRSLSNPRLQVFICCYDAAARDALSDEFRQHKNVACLALDGGKALDFSALNQDVLVREGEMAPKPPEGSPAPAADQSGSTASTTP